jgi:hypothetical protein
MRKSIPALALVLLVIGTTAGCQALILKKEDSVPRKTAKVAGRVAQFMAFGFLGEAYYAGQRAKQ